MPEQILVTGGAGFIGLHLVDGLLRAGHGVRVLDSLVEQVRGDSQRPEYLARDAELIAGDVRNAEVVRGALEDTDSVVHLAARVGVGQSMYEPPSPPPTRPGPACCWRRCSTTRSASSSWPRR